jgi:hypothetical protein
MFFERISRGWSLTKTSFKVLRLDPEILWLPLLAGVIMVVAVLGLGFGYLGASFIDDSGLLGYVALFAIYVVSYGIAIFFNAAVIEMATIRFNGGDPVVKDGLRKAWQRKTRIIQWALVAATVGLLFRVLRDHLRDNPIARIFVGLLEGAWAAVTFFVVPIAVFQDIGPVDAIKRSTGMMKRTWGESLTGVFTTGIIFFLLGLLGLVPLAIGFLSGSPGVFMATLVVAVLYWIGLAAVNSAVDGILVAALYKYANEGQLPQAFRDEGVRADALAY